MYTYGVDIGGTSIKIGLAEVNGTNVTIIRQWSIATNKENDGANILNEVAASIDKDMVTAGITKDMTAGVGLGVPGPVLPDGRVNRCVNIGWGLFNVEETLSGLCGLPVRAGNDANVAALGEMAMGGGRGYRDLVMVTLGTGVGGGIVLDGHILRGNNGAAGEIGHIHVEDNESEPCGCGNFGCLEQYASATGIVRLYEKKLGRGGLTSLSGMTGFTCKDVFDNAAKGNGRAKAAIDDAARYLGKALACISCTVNPQVFVIGGGVSEAGEVLLEQIRLYFRQYAFHAAKGTPIVAAELKGEAGLYGAAFLASLS